MKYYMHVIKNYTNFTGRARRSEYWYFVLFNCIFAILALGIDTVLGLGASMGYFGVVYMLYMLFALIPSLAVGVRRLHDVGKSGWYLLIALIPLIGAIWLLVLLFTDSQPGENKWGPNPKETTLFGETTV